MRQIKNQNLAQLLMQLKFAPAKHRRKQLDAVEKLLMNIDKDNEYPFDFVCFQITGFHPKNLPQLQPIKGVELAEDLRIFISRLSGQLNQRTSEQNQKVYSIKELAEELGISTKTVHRWRQRGLTAQKFIFEDGKKLLGFSQSVVDRFFKKNPTVVEKAKVFSRLTKKEGQNIIRKTVVLASKTEVSRHQIISLMAAEMGRAHETIRYTIKNYEKNNPGKYVFNRLTEVITPVQAGEIYALYKQGYNIKKLMEQFGKSKSSIYRIINQRRLRALMAKKIEFISSSEFVEETAMGKILAKPLNSYVSVVFGKTKTPELAADSISEYLKVLKNAPVLNRERETELFRRYNFLKYMAFKTRAAMNPARISSVQLRTIEKYLAEADSLKKMIIEANLRLVVGIASRHTTSGGHLLDLVSEGNLSLMRAVEKFDYTRGVRFGTYAGWVIAKDYARKIPTEAARHERETTTSITEVQRDLRITATLDFAAIERARQSLVQVITDELDEREQYIILNHFGLVGSVIKKKKKTLNQIGQELNLSKERIRQIELGALQKLRHCLSIEEFELLMG